MTILPDSITEKEWTLPDSKHTEWCGLKDSDLQCIALFVVGALASQEVIDVEIPGKMVGLHDFEEAVRVVMGSLKKFRLQIIDDEYPMLNLD